MEVARQVLHGWKAPWLQRARVPRRRSIFLLILHGWRTCAKYYIDGNHQGISAHVYPDGGVCLSDTTRIEDVRQVLHGWRASELQRACVSRLRSVSQPSLTLCRDWHASASPRHLDPG
eukprot:7087827-Pyramimonas_sp.AAC.1